MFPAKSFRAGVPAGHERGPQAGEGHALKDFAVPTCPRVSFGTAPAPRARSSTASRDSSWREGRTPGSDRYTDGAWKPTYTQLPRRSARGRAGSHAGRTANPARSKMLQSTVTPPLACTLCPNPRACPTAAGSSGIRMLSTRSGYRCDFPIQPMSHSRPARPDSQAGTSTRTRLGSLCSRSCSR